MKLTLEAINQAIAVLFFVCYAYQFVYIPVALLRRRKRLPAAAPHRFAVLIAARNEETVIGDLLDSLHAQDYDMSLITVFVIADNCTDRTAAIASEKGAVVYTRQNKQAVGKGYALEALLAHIKSDYPDGYDAYLVFDADNLLAPDFLTRMNESFSAGNEIITCYRNSKNYGSNWISAGYALWFLRESRFLNGAREALGSSCAVSGTGFLFSQKILNECGGWPFHLLVEDIEFSIHNILSGHRIAICQDAVIYDEQPTDFAQSCRQRLRWAKGYIQVFQRYGGKLLKGAARGSWSCFDMSMSILPAFILTALCLLANITLSVLGLMQGVGVWFAMRSLLECMGSILATLLVLGGITTVTEWNQIRTSSVKKFVYVFTFPLFMFTYIPISLAAFFCKPQWKPIEHRVSAAHLRSRDRQEVLPF